MKPPFLQQGDTVAVVATGKCLGSGQLDQALEQIASWGLKLKLGKHLYDSENYFAGSDEDRAADFQEALDDVNVKAILFARGGYGTVRVVDLIDWTSFINTPKWLCGFSDLTVIHSHVHRQWNIETLHATMPIFFTDGGLNSGAASLRRALFGEQLVLHWDQHHLNRSGKTEGQLIGGNLAVLHSIMSSASEVNYQGKVLFIEDLGEHLYHLDRTMQAFKRAGRLNGLAGLVVGQFSDMVAGTPPFGKQAEEIILETVKEYDFPVAFNAPIGHVENNQAVYSGANAVLEVASESTLNFK